MTGGRREGYDDAFRSALVLLKQASSVLITSHINPDGDAIGSMLGLGHALASQGHAVTMALQDPVPAACQFLPGAERIRRPPVEGSFDLTAMLDCEGPYRTGELEAVVRSASRLLVIDHHPSERAWGTVEIRDTTAAATGEILADLLQAGGYALTAEIADCLLAAIMLDTGGFRHSNTSPHALLVAATLVERGARVSVIHRELFENRSLAAARLLGIALGNIQTTEDQRIVYTYLTRSDFERTGAGENETDGINNQLIGIAGIEASALFREASKGGIRVSLRSREWLDCNAVARAFGGGGHVRASGCTVDRPLAETIRLVIAEMEKQRPAASSA